MTKYCNLCNFFCSFFSPPMYFQIMKHPNSQDNIQDGKNITEMYAIWFINSFVKSTNLFICRISSLWKISSEVWWRIRRWENWIWIFFLLNNNIYITIGEIIICGPKIKNIFWCIKFQYCYSPLPIIAIAIVNIALPRSFIAKCFPLFSPIAFKTGNFRERNN